MTLELSESNALAVGLIDKHEPRALGVASLLYTTRVLFRKASTAEALDLEGLVELQDRCAAAWMAEHGIAFDAVQAAFADIQRAKQTAEYIRYLPG